MPDQPIQLTRFEELGYQMQAPGLWRIIDLTDDRHASIGQHYPTKTALLGDLERYASDFGAALATPRHVCPVPYVNSYTELALLLLAFTTLDNARHHLTLDNFAAIDSGDVEPWLSLAFREIASAAAAVSNQTALLVGRFAR